MNILKHQNTNNPERYTVVIGTFLTLISLGLVISSFGVFFKPLSSEFGWTRGDTSGAFSTAMVISGLMALVSGRLADRFSPRLIITICGALLGCACLLLSQTTSLLQLFLYFGVIAGCGMSVMIPTTSLIVRIYKKRRGFMTGITQSGASIGSIAAAPFITLLISVFNWRTSYVILGVVVLIITAISLALLRDPLKESLSNHQADLLAETKTKRKVDYTLVKALGSGRFWAFGLILFCAGFAQSILLVHIIPHTTDIGISPIIAAAILSVLNVACTIGNFAIGRTSDLIGGRLSMILCFISIVIGMIILLFANTIWVFYIVVVLVGIGFAGTATLRSPMVAELFGLRSHGVITGAIMFIYTIGSAIGPLMAGYIFDIYNQYQPAFIISTVVCVMGLAVAFLLKFRLSATN